MHRRKKQNYLLWITVHVLLKTLWFRIIVFFSLQAKTLHSLMLPFFFFFFFGLVLVSCYVSYEFSILKNANNFCKTKYTCVSIISSTFTSQGLRSIKKRSQLISCGYNKTRQCIKWTLFYECSFFKCSQAYALTIVIINSFIIAPLVKK